MEINFTEMADAFIDTCRLGGLVDVNILMIWLTYQSAYRHHQNFNFTWTDKENYEVSE